MTGVLALQSGPQLDHPLHISCSWDTMGTVTLETETGCKRHRIPFQETPGADKPVRQKTDRLLWRLGVRLKRG